MLWELRRAFLQITESRKHIYNILYKISSMRRTKKLLSDMGNEFSGTTGKRKRKVAE